MIEKIHRNEGETIRQELDFYSMTRSAISRHCCLTSYHSEWNLLGHTQGFPFFESNIVIDMHDVTSRKLHENVVQMPVTEANDVANDTHHGQ